MSTPLTSHPRLAAFVLSEASGQRSRENVVVTQTGTAIKSGTVLVKSTISGAGTFTRDADAAGNFTSGTITVGPTATPGTYTGKFLTATTYELKDPDGVNVDDGATGVAFSAGGLGFTLTAGATPAEKDDLFTIVVTASAVKYIPYTANGAAGDAAGILYSHLPAATGDADAVAFVRDCEVNRKALIGLDDAGEADLQAVGIQVRGETGALGIQTPAL